MDQLLLQALAAGTRLLHNATEHSTQVDAELAEAKSQVAQAQVDVQEAVAEVARQADLPFSEDTARAAQNKIKADQSLAAAQVAEQHAREATTQVSQEIVDYLALIDTIHRIENQHPRPTLEALIAGYSHVFTQLDVKLPGEDGLVSSYDYYYDDEDPPSQPPSMLVKVHSPPPPSPSTPVSKKAIEKQIEEILGPEAEKQYEALELQVLKHPVFAAAVGVVACLIVLYCFCKCCRPARAVVEVTDARPDEFDYDDEMIDEDEEFEEVEMHETNGRGRARATRKQERETLNVAASSNDMDNGHGSRGGRHANGRRARC